MTERVREGGMKGEREREEEGGRWSLYGMEGVHVDE